MSANLTAARVTRPRTRDVIKLSKDGKYHFNPSQLKDIVVNVPPVFAQAGYYLVAVQAPNGNMNVGLTNKINIADISTIDDVTRLFQVKKIVSGPETLKEKKERKELFQNLVFSLGSEHEAKEGNLWVRSSLDTEYIRIEAASKNLQAVVDVLAAHMIVHPTDEYFRDRIFDLVCQALTAQVKYLQSFVGASEKEKTSLGDVLVEHGVPAWFYSRFGSQKFEHPRDKPLWTVFFKASIEKSLFLTIHEVRSPKIQEMFMEFPGFEELAIFVNALTVNDDNVEDSKKSKLFVPPRGFEAEIISEIKPARAPVDTSSFKEESLIWNVSRMGLLGVTNPNGHRDQLWRDLFGVEVEQGEKFNPKDLLAKSQVQKYDLYTKPTEKMIMDHMSNAGIPARLVPKVRDFVHILFPKEKHKDEEKAFPWKRLDMFEISYKYQFWGDQKRRLHDKVPRSVDALIKVDRNTDSFRKFAESEYFKKHLTLKGGTSNESIPNSALTQRSLALLAKVKKHETFSYMAPILRTYLGSFVNPKFMDLAATEISMRLANYVEGDFEDDEASEEEEDSGLADF
jgi:hypothetical protein